MHTCYICGADIYLVEYKTMADEYSCRGTPQHSFIITEDIRKKEADNKAAREALAAERTEDL